MKLTVLQPIILFLSKASATDAFCSNQFSRTSQSISNPRFGRRGLHHNSFQEASPLFTTTTETGIIEKESSDTQQQHGKQLDYNWKDQWYAITFENYIPSIKKSSEPTKASIFGHKLVLWRNDKNEIVCANDQCPHRAAALSEGRVSNDGKELACLYHGWKFDSLDGKANCIPQLPPDAPIPKRACLQLHPTKVEDGVVWIWMGDDDKKPTKAPPRTCPYPNDHPNRKNMLTFFDFQYDFDADHSFLMENLFDPAHIPTVHANSFGNQDDAQPFVMEIDNKGEITSDGFVGKFRRALKSTTSSKMTDKLRDDTRNINSTQWDKVIFEAPATIRWITNEGNGVLGHLAFHVTPIDVRRARFIFRLQFENPPRILRIVTALTPKWVRNLSNCQVMEKDLGFIRTQQSRFTDQSSLVPPHLQDEYLPLKSSDLLVATYRKWLDKVGHGMPWFWGYASRSAPVHSFSTSSPTLTESTSLASITKKQAAAESRYYMHVVNVPETRDALRNIQRLKRALVCAMVSSVSLGCTLMLAAAAASSAPSAAVSSRTMASTAGVGGSAFVKHGLLSRIVGGSATPLCRLIRFLSGPAIPVFALGAAVLHGLEQRFYVNYSRKRGIL